jgi:hypothetical protein
VAKSRVDNQTDHRINPPLKLLNEVVLDPRTQYPIKVEPLSSQLINPLIIPVESEPKTTSRKRYIQFG